MPSKIFIGSATTKAPIGGNKDRFPTFSKIGICLAVKIRWLTKRFDWPKSMLGVSKPIALISRLSTIHWAASGFKPGKCKSFTPSSPRMSVPR